MLVMADEEREVRVPTRLSHALEAHRLRKGKLDQASAAKQVSIYTDKPVLQTKWSRWETGQMPSPAELRAIAAWMEAPVAAVILLAYDIDPEPYGLLDGAGATANAYAELRAEMEAMDARNAEYHREMEKWVEEMTAATEQMVSRYAQGIDPAITLAAQSGDASDTTEQAEAALANARPTRRKKT